MVMSSSTGNFTSIKQFIAQIETERDFDFINHFNCDKTICFTSQLLIKLYCLYLVIL